jgi:hypothetical protein
MPRPFRIRTVGTHCCDLSGCCRRFRRPLRNVRFVGLGSNAVRHSFELPWTQPQPLQSRRKLFGDERLHRILCNSTNSVNGSKSASVSRPENRQLQARVDGSRIDCSMYGQLQVISIVARNSRQQTLTSYCRLPSGTSNFGLVLPILCDRARVVTRPACLLRGAHF